MSELAVREFLRAVDNAGRNMASRPAGDAMVADAVVALVEAAGVLTSPNEATIGVTRQGFTLGDSLLAHVSIEFSDAHRVLRDLGVGSITVVPGADARDLADLAALVHGLTSDLPAGRTVRLGQSTSSISAGADPLEGAYRSALGALRAMSEGGALHVDDVMAVVDQFLAGETADPSSSIMLSTIRRHDATTFQHSVNVCLLSLALGRVAGLDEPELRLLGTGALLHDIGRVLLDEVALRKQGSLTNKEWAQVRLHPQEGAQAIMAASGAGQAIAALVALEHHFRLDGTGYPDLGRAAPHMFSRIVAIADTYDAVTSHRPHRPARTPAEALGVLLADAGTAFDGDLVRAFIQVMGTYPPGSLLRLTSGEIVMVADSVAGRLRTGVVVRSATGEALSAPEPINLEGRKVAGQLLAIEAGLDHDALLVTAEQGRRQTR